MLPLQGTALRPLVPLGSNLNLLVTVGAELVPLGSNWMWEWALHPLNLRPRWDRCRRGRCCRDCVALGSQLSDLVEQATADVSVLLELFLHALLCVPQSQSSRGICPVRHWC